MRYRKDVRNSVGLSPLLLFFFNAPFSFFCAGELATNCCVQILNFGETVQQNINLSAQTVVSAKAACLDYQALYRNRSMVQRSVYASATKIQFFSELLLLSVLLKNSTVCP